MLYEAERLYYRARGHRYDWAKIWGGEAASIKECRDDIGGRALERLKNCPGTGEGLYREDILD